jgi:hypothetical protein
MWQRYYWYVKFIGKKSSQGMGAVLEWVVEKVSASTEEPADAFVDFILNKRTIPLEMIGGGAGPLLGWTPPYWYRPWHSHVVRPHPDLVGLTWSQFIQAQAAFPHPASPAHVPI